MANESKKVTRPAALSPEEFQVALENAAKAGAKEPAEAQKYVDDIAAKKIAETKAAEQAKKAGGGKTAKAGAKEPADEEPDDGAGLPFDLADIDQPDGLSDDRFVQLVRQAASYNIHDPVAVSRFVRDHSLNPHNAAPPETVPMMRVGHEKILPPIQRKKNGGFEYGRPRPGQVIPHFMHPAPPPAGCEVLDTQLAAAIQELDLSDREVQDALRKRRLEKAISGR